MTVVLIINSRGTIKEKTIKDAELPTLQKLAKGEEGFACLHVWKIEECDGAQLHVYGVAAPVDEIGGKRKRNPCELPTPMDRTRITGTMLLLLRDASDALSDLPLESWTILNRILHKAEEDIVVTKKPRKRAQSSKQTPDVEIPNVACSTVLTEEEYL